MSATRPPGHAAEDALLDAFEVLRRSVGADDEAFPGRNDFVHRVEEFDYFLGDTNKENNKYLSRPDPMYFFEIIRDIREN